MTRSPERYRQDTRPRSVTLTGWGVLLVGLVNIWRSASLFRQLELLLELDVTPDPRMRLVIAVAWSLFFCVLAAAIWRRFKMVRFVVPVGLFIYAIYRMAIVYVSPADSGFDRIWLNLAVYGAAILFSIWALNRPEAVEYLTTKE
jgi:hypothetical protein